MANRKPNKVKIVLTVSYMLLILATSIIPMDKETTGLKPFSELNATLQNLLHIPVFAILSILFLQISKGYRLKGCKRIAGVLICCGFYGIFNEIIQISVPGRYSSILDMGLNLIGSIVGIISYITAEKIKYRIIR